MAFPRIKNNFLTCQMNDNNRDILNCLLEFLQQFPFLRISDCYYSLNSTSGICGLSLKPNIDPILLGSKLYDHNNTILLKKRIFHEQYTIICWNYTIIGPRSIRSYDFRIMTTNESVTDYQSLWSYDISF